jgi:hypothetical protein
MRCGAAIFGHWGSLLECDLPQAHDGMHYDERLNVTWLAGRVPEHPPGGSP